MPGRPGARIPGHVDPDALLASFETGDPHKVFDAFSTLVRAYREVAHEAARLRFVVNFGTTVCENCEGLKAGPGVVATCYQVKACNFTNIKEAETDPRRLRVLQNLLGDSKTP